MTLLLDQYCGPPPLPSNLWSQWNLDPILIVVMAAICGANLLLLFKKGQNVPEWRFCGAAWFVLIVLFVTPFCALTSALFAARVAHHVLLIAVVAPLFVFSAPAQWLKKRVSAGAITAIFIAHIVVLWAWHSPRLYEAALSSPAIFWTMQLSLLATATALWFCILSPRVPLVYALAALLGSVMQMGWLGAIITFAPAPMYAAHFGVTEPFGLSALADQQLAGLIMWVPAAVPYIAAALMLFGAHYRRLESAV